MKPHIAYTIALIVMLFIISVLGFEIMQQDHRVQGLQSALSERNSQLEYHRNYQGKLVAEKQVAELRLKEFKESYPALAASIAKEFDIKLRNLRSYQQTDFRAEGHGNADIYSITEGTTYVRQNGDTVTYSNGKWVRKHEASLQHIGFTSESTFNPFAVVIQDGYLDAQVDVYDSLNAPYNYTYSDTVKQIFTLKGKFWQKKKLFSQTMLSNPNAKVVGSTSIVVKEYKDKRWGIGPSISYGIGQDGRLQTNLGVSIHYSIIKF